VRMHPEQKQWPQSTEQGVRKSCAQMVQVRWASMSARQGKGVAFQLYMSISKDAIFGAKKHTK
jgi:hypothetical protein